MKKIKENVRLEIRKVIKEIFEESKDAANKIIEDFVNNTNIYNFDLKVYEKVSKDDLELKEKGDWGGISGEFDCSFNWGNGETKYSVILMGEYEGTAKMVASPEPLVGYNGDIETTITVSLESFTADSGDEMEPDIELNVLNKFEHLNSDVIFQVEQIIKKLVDKKIE